nr:hypothetical protein [Tanacetum cinerariifolium]
LAGHAHAQVGQGEGHDACLRILALAGLNGVVDGQVPQLLGVAHRRVEGRGEVAPRVEGVHAVVERATRLHAGREHAAARRRSGRVAP